MRKYAPAIILIAILILAFTLRLAAFDHPLATNGGEGIKDLFVAKHALVYGEWPLTGHHNGLSTIENSPLYYYLVIVFAAIAGPTFLSTGTLYILFQTLFIALLFFLVRALFTTPTALIAAFLVAIAPHYIIDASSTYFWPPYLIAPFVVGSLLALWYGYKKNISWPVGSSPLLMLMALAIHQSVIAVLPLFALLTLYVAHHQSFSLKKYLGVGALCLAFFAALFIPPIINANSSTLEWGTRVETKTPTTIAEGLSRAATGTPYAFGIYRPPNDYPFDDVFAMLLIFSLWFFITNTVPRDHKINMGILLGFFLSMAGAAIVFDPEGVPRHFEAVLWVVPVLFAVVIASGLRERRFIFPLALVVFLLLTFSSLSDQRLSYLYANIGTFNTPHYHLVDRAVEKIADEVHIIKEREHFTDYTFFNIVMRGSTSFWISPYLFWLPLEERLQVQLDKGPNKTSDHFIVRHSYDYLFYTCINETSQNLDEHCRAGLQDEYPDHDIAKEVFAEGPIVIFLVERASQEAP